GLRVLAIQTIRPRHPKAGDSDDALHVARSAEVTMLWQLVAHTPA
ncbi:MAG: methyltransferase, partial [Sphaerotilus sp.]